MPTLKIDLPDPLYEVLKSRAAANHRSASDEALDILTGLLADPPPLSILDLQGLGRDLGTGIDAAQHVDEERRSWSTPE